MKFRYIINNSILYNSLNKHYYFQIRFKCTTKKNDHTQSIPTKEYEYQKNKYIINNDNVSNTTKNDFGHIKKSLPIIIDVLFSQKKDKK